MVQPTEDVTDTLTKQTRTNMSTMVCKYHGLVQISRHYKVVMDLCPLGPCFPL